MISDKELIHQLFNGQPTLDEQAELYKKIYACPDDHEKMGMRLYSPLPTGDISAAQMLEHKDFSQITCISCKTKGNNKIYATENGDEE